MNKLIDKNYKITFGQHFGKHIKDVPKEYIDFMLKSTSNKLNEAIILKDANHNGIRQYDRAVNAYNQLLNVISEGLNS